MNGEQLRHAREINGLTQAALAEVVGVQQSMIALLERGARAPSDALLEAIAKETGYPVSFFEQESEPEFPLGSLLYRKHSILSSVDKCRSYRMGRQSYRLFQHLAKRVKPTPLRLPVGIEDGPSSAAPIVRSLIGCEPDSPVKNLINKLERSGVAVIILPEAIEHLDAYSTWVGNRPVIILSPGKPGDRQRMSIGHEIGHLVSPFPGSSDDAEKEADRFAGELLLPRKAIKREMSMSLTLSNLAELKPRWGVSIQALVYRARELDLITPRQAKYLWMQIAKRGWRTKEPDSLYVTPEKPRALRKMAEVLYGDPVDYKSLANELHLPLFWVKRAIESYASKEELTNAPKSPESKVLDFRPKAG